MSFLELTKNLAPQAVRHTLTENIGCIDTRIDFTKSDDEDDYMGDFEQPQPMTIFKPPPEKK